MNAIETVLHEGQENGVYPGAAVVLGNSTGIELESYVGRLRLDGKEKVDPKTWFDVASLTKVMVTGILWMKTVEKGRVVLDDPIQRFFPNTKHPYTIRHLLCHASGLPAWKPYYEKLVQIGSPSDRMDYVIQTILQEPLEAAPGERATYSDLGFILLGNLLEKVREQSLKDLSEKEVFEPAGMRDCQYGAPATASVAATEDCPFRKEVIQGKVHDLNAWALGGICGHAGIFSTANNVARFAEHVLKNIKGQKVWAQSDLFAKFIKPQHLPKTSTWALSWDMPSATNSSTGSYWPSNSIGHLGYTGCSVWINPENDFYCVCLTNRIHPDDANKQIKTFRPILHDAVWKWFQSKGTS